MKHMMKYRQIFRALAWALALALLVGCATLPALAKPEAETEENLYMTWTRFSSTGMVNGHDPETDTTYRYSTVTMMSPRIRFLPGAYYQYANTVEAENGKALKVLAPGFGSDFILLDEFLRDLDEIQHCRSLTIFRRIKSTGPLNRNVPRC